MSGSGSQGRYSSLHRMLTLIRYLSSVGLQGASIDDLASELECSDRTVYRYIEELEVVGVEIRKEKTDTDKAQRMILIHNPFDTKKGT